MYFCLVQELYIVSTKSDNRLCTECACRVVDVEQNVGSSNALNYTTTSIYTMWPIIQILDSQLPLPPS